MAATAVSGTGSRVFTSAEVVLPASNDSNDTTMINATLAANVGKVVKGRPGENYLISSPIIVQSGQTLDMTGCTVTLNASSDCNMVNNASMTAVRTVSDGAITSATTTLTSATAAFTSADVGRTVYVAGAATGGYLLVAKITLIGSSTSVTINTAAGTTVSGAALTIYSRDSNISMIGGTWARGSNAGSNSNLHSIRLRHVDNLSIRDLSATSSAGKYAVSLADVTKVDVKDLYFSTSSDGVHLSGPAQFVTIENIYGTTGDDMVGITPQDYSAYADSLGDVTDVAVTNVHSDASNEAVKVLGGAAGAAKRIRIRNVFGTVATNVGVWIGDDSAQAGTTGGVVDAVSVENVALSVPNAKPVVLINGTATRHVRVSGVAFENASATEAAIRIAPSSAGTFKSITISDLVSNASGSSQFLIKVETNATVQRMIVARSHVTDPSSGALIQVTGAVTNLAVESSHMVGATGGILVQVNGTVTGLSVTGSHIGSVTGGFLVSVLGTVTDLAIRGVSAVTTGSWYALSLDAATGTATVTRATLSDVHLSASGGGFVNSTHGSHTLPVVELVNCMFTGAAWIGDLNCTTDFQMSNVNTASASGYFNLRTSAALTVRGSNLNLSAGGSNLALTGGATAKSKTLGFSVDVSKLTKTDGDLATNTNAGLGCGAGPVISNGSLWKHLYTGATA